METASIFLSMSDSGQLVLLAEDISVALVAITLICHHVTRDNTMSELSAENLIDSITENFEHHSITQFIPFKILTKCADAVQQGFKLFKKSIEIQQIDVIKKQIERDVWGGLMVTFVDKAEVSVENFRVI